MYSALAGACTNRIGERKRKVNTERKWTNERRKEKTDQRHHGKFKVLG